MGWEDRNGNRYYYRKRREGKRVVSEYVGTGFLGTMAEGLDREERTATEHERRTLMKQKATAARIDGEMNEIGEITQAFTRACLLLAGYHAPNRQWRKRRNVR